MKNQITWWDHPKFRFFNFNNFIWDFNELQFYRSNFMNECNYDRGFSDVPGILAGQVQRHADADANPCGGESPVECDYFSGVFDYINQMLMEEDDLQDKPCMWQDYYALQAAEKYFYDALLSDKDSSASVNAGFRYQNPDLIGSEPGFGQVLGEGSGVGDSGKSLCDFRGSLYSPFLLQNSSKLTLIRESGDSGIQIDDSSNRDSGPKQTNSEGGGDGEANLANEESFRKKNRGRGESDDCAEARSSKQMASFADEQEQMEKYDKSLLCRKMDPGFYKESPVCNCEESLDAQDESLRLFRKSTEVKRGRPKGSKNHGKSREVIDLMNLLARCAEAVSSFNIAAGEEILKQIRQYSSPYGDANERLAHCFGNALEARMAGTGSALCTAFAARRIAASELLKSYQTYVASCPFKRMSNIFANKSIGRYMRKASRIHVIDFGIMYGFQWPCLIQGLSLRPGGAPLLKITGIDFPQPGFKPAERVEQTGRRLMNYCKRFNVPFEYNAIAKKWENICIEDLKIERDEMVVVNCMYRLHHVPDESAAAGVNSPRDCVLKLIKKINPDLFVHGVINGTYNAPFFLTRFREVLHHYSSFFDMLEATIPREDQDRLMYEREVLGREVMNVVACEGVERVERPETYKQCHVRDSRAGFKQLPLNREILREVRSKVCNGYHISFSLEEDGGWMLQGWKGRVMCALSCWKPIQE
ncbi:scarecrow-like protein 30 [Henckelia pumila]|uniref:scarecrow-like protein 30 n=1 Tax=Henckelia pumila TaxID=405737 RepID=UPI003C6DE802